jgi:hypothetical protein
LSQASPAQSEPSLLPIGGAKPSASTTEPFVLPSEAVRLTAAPASSSDRVTTAVRGSGGAGMLPADTPVDVRSRPPKVPVFKRTGVAPIEDGRQVIGRVALQRLLQAVTAVGHRGQVTDLRNARGPRLRTHLLGQGVEL